MPILDANLTYLPCFGHKQKFTLEIQKCNFYPTFNVCHQIYFKKKLRNKFGEKFKKVFILGPKTSVSLILGIIRIQLISMQKSKTLVVSFLGYWLSNNSAILMDESTFWS